MEFTSVDIQRIHQFLVRAVKQGRLSEERLNESVSRILALKKKYGLFCSVSESIAPLTKEAQYSHQMLARQIAGRALRLIQGSEQLPLSLKSSSLLIVAPDCLRDGLVQTDWQSLGPRANIFYFKGLNPDQSAIEEIKALAQKSEKCIYFAYNMWRSQGQQELFRYLQKVSPYTIAIAACDFIDVEYLKLANIVLCTFSPVPYSLQAALDHLGGLK